MPCRSPYIRCTEYLAKGERKNFPEIMNFLLDTRNMLYVSITTVAYIYPTGGDEDGEEEGEEESC
jgi:hypothetical protein